MVKLLVGVTGSVASIKLPLLIDKIRQVWKEHGCEIEIKVVTTQAAQHFFDSNTCGAPVITDEQEWLSWKKIGDPVVHIELRHWADAFLIAPLDANTLAKMANGLCDNLLTCIVRAWDQSKPLIVCPAMNTHMWNHPFTAKHLHTLENELRYHIIPPIVKTLACGDTGVGAMAHPEDIAQFLYSLF